MSTLASVWITKEKLQSLIEEADKNFKTGVDLTISIDDKTNDKGQNLVMYINQSKEQREAGESKKYAGNGKVFWTDGKIVKAEPKTQ